MKRNILEIKTTCPNIETAKLIAEAVVSEKLAACAQIGGEIESVYVWKGAVHRENEIPLIIKTSEKSLDALRNRVFRLHSYECPQWIVASVAASKQYADWVEENTAP